MQQRWLLVSLSAPLPSEVAISNQGADPVFGEQGAFDHPGSISCVQAAPGTHLQLLATGLGLGDGELLACYDLKTEQSYSLSTDSRVPK